MRFLRKIALLAFFFPAVFLSSELAASPVGAELEDSLRAAKTKFDRTEMLIGAAREVAESDSAGALDLLKRAAKTAKGDPLAEANAADARGLFYYERLDYASSIAWYERAAEIFRESDLPDKAERFTSLLNHIGKIYLRIGANDESVRITLEAARVAREAGLTGWEAYACVNLGNLFHRERNSAQAWKYFKRAERLARASSDPHKASGALNGLGLVQLYERKFSEAFSTFANAFQIADSLLEAEGPKPMLIRDNAAFLHNMARAKLGLNKFSQASKYLKQGLALLSKAKAGFDAAEDLIDFKLALGDLYRRVGNYSLSRQYLLEALAMVRKRKIKGYLHVALWKYAQLLKVTGPAEELNAVYREYISLRDEIVSDTRQTAILETEARYNVKAKIDEIASLRAASEAERNLNIALTAVALIFLAGAVYVWLSRKRLARAHRKLGELTRFREQFVGMLVHDLKNPLNAVLGLSSSTEIVRHRKAIRQAARQMLNLTLNLLDVQKFEEAGIKPNSKPVLFEELAAEALEQTAFLAESNRVELSFEADETLTLEADPELMTRALVNLLTNAVKYAESRARLVARMEAEKVVVKVEDDGPGVPEAQRAAIFEAFSQFESRGAGAAKSTGVGLTFCKLAVEAHDGAIRAEASEALGGAAFVIELPAGAAASGAVKDARAQKYLSTKAKTEKRRAMSEAERELLADTARKLSGVEVFEISEITDALEPLREHAHSGVREWAAQLENAALNIDEAAYRRQLAKAAPSRVN